MSGGTPKPIIILGTGGNCVDILDTILDLEDHPGRPEFECIGFLDDNQSTWGREIRGVKVLGPLAITDNYPAASFVNGIGSVNNFWRKESIIAKTRLPLERFETIIHPTASVSRMSALGHGTVVLQNVTIASNVTVGNHVIILPNSVLSHDDVVGDYTCITGGVCVSGNVRIGKSCYLGTNSTIDSNLTLGDSCLVGMGSVVRRDVEARSVVVGNPARHLRSVPAA